MFSFQCQIRSISHLMHFSLQKYAVSRINSKFYVLKRLKPHCEKRMHLNTTEMNDLMRFSNFKCPFCPFFLIHCLIWSTVKMFSECEQSGICRYDFFFTISQKQKKHVAKLFEFLNGIHVAVDRLPAPFSTIPLYTPDIAFERALMAEIALQCITLMTIRN